MRKRNLALVIAAVSTVAIGAAGLSAQNSNPRFGVWKMKSDAPPPSINIMTYEAYGDGGMRITVESTNRSGRESKWGYVTMFDGEFLAVEGQENSRTAVEIVDDRINRISNMRNGRRPFCSAIELTRRLVEVPISVQVPPIIAKNESGISSLLGLIWFPVEARSTIGRKIATTAVLLMNAETGAITIAVMISNATGWVGPCSSNRSPR